VRGPTLPPIPREDPLEHTPVELEPSPSLEAATQPETPGPRDDAAESALIVEIEEARATNDALFQPAPNSQAVAVAPHRPPAPSLVTPAPLPSVIVDVDREFAALVDRVVQNGTDEQAEAELLRQGQYAMVAIMARFPGPIAVTPERMDEMPPPRASDCGPILRLIAGQRKVALPFVLPEVSSKDPERRFWATYLLTELAYAEAVPAVVARLLDPREPTRRVARMAAKAIAEVAGEQLVAELDRIVRDPSAGPETRVSTIETLGEMRDALVVPVLIRSLADESQEVSIAARTALVILSRQDFGRDSKKWQSWWSSNSGRHRIEWLIDALTHEEGRLRRVAGQELKALTKEYFGYYDDLPRKERDRAQQRYREWWKAEGRARFRKL
jgi:HEAT repeat protein